MGSFGKPVKPSVPDNSFLRINDFVVLEHKEHRHIVYGVLTHNFQMGPGLSSIFNLRVIYGLPVNSAIFNTNLWSVLATGQISEEYEALFLYLARGFNGDV